jgi:hypothetical protein
MPRQIGKWGLLLMLLASIQLLGANGLADTQSRPWEDKIDGIIASLSKNIDSFEDLQRRMADLSRSNEKYSEQKNIWLSSTLTLAAIAAVCEYQRDLLTLFADLRATNRTSFYDVRLKSLRLSVEQIAVMREQMQINHSLIAHRKDELALVPKENRLIDSSMDLLRQAIKQIQSNH